MTLHAPKISLIWCLFIEGGIETEIRRIKVFSYFPGLYIYSVKRPSGLPIPHCSIFFLLLFFFFLRFYLFRERKREGERKGEKHGSVASHTCPNQGPGPQPRHVPWPGIQLMTFHFAVWQPTNWAMLARAYPSLFSITVGDGQSLKTQR